MNKKEQVLDVLKCFFTMSIQKRDEVLSAIDAIYNTPPAPKRDHNSLKVTEWVSLDNFLILNCINRKQEKVISCLEAELEECQQQKLNAHNEVELQVKKLTECQRERDALREAYDAAHAYIEASPCDPDISPQQWAAYERYLDAVKALAATRENDSNENG